MFESEPAPPASKAGGLAVRPGALEEVVAAAVREIATLQDALARSRRIGAAVGIVMATRKLTYDAAFEILRTASQNSNRKLRDVAEDVVMTGLVPVPPTPRSVGLVSRSSPIVRSYR